MSRQAGGELSCCSHRGSGDSGRKIFCSSRRSTRGPIQKIGKEIPLAVKLVRQVKKIALIGAPTSAAALSAGHERAPEALRAAGLIPRLQAAGFEVTDLGDSIKQTFQPDDEHPRARNIAPLVTVLNDLRPRVEVAVKSGALPLIIGGDCSIVLATVAGSRRYYRHVGVIYVDRHAEMNVPATTPSGCVDGMVASHLVGRGAPELVRFWGEPPLVREPDVVLFGVSEIDAPEKQALERSPIRRYLKEDIQRKGIVAAAEEAAARMQGPHEYILHFDVDVMSRGDFSASTYAGDGGLSLAETQQALSILASRDNMIAMEVTTYNPALDPDGSQAKVLIELIAGVLTARLTALETPAQVAADADESAAASEPPAIENVAAEPAAPEPAEPEAASPNSEEAPTSSEPAAAPDEPASE
jgi:arginase